MKHEILGTGITPHLDNAKTQRQQKFIYDLLKKSGVNSISPQEAALRDRQSSEIERDISPEAKVCQLIQKHMEAVNSTYIKKGRSKIPDIHLPDFVQTLFTVENLWLQVGGHRFVPDVVVKQLINPKLGEKNSKRFSVFVADKKRDIARRWGVRPLAAENKSRHQYWDEKFVQLFIATVIYNSTDYTVRNDIHPEELVALKEKAILETATPT